jgi:hypothetical protein
MAMGVVRCRFLAAGVVAPVYPASGVSTRRGAGIDRCSRRFGFGAHRAELRRWLAGLVAAVLVAAGAVAESGVSSKPTRRGGTGLAAVTRLPLQAQSVISTAVGAGEPAFAARRTPGGYRLAGGGVGARSSAQGMLLRVGGGSVLFGSVTLAHGGRVARLAALTVTGRGNRVLFDRGQLSEWYAAGPLGVEQGFTVTRRPAGSGRWLTVGIGLSGTLRAELSGSGVRFLTGSGRAALRYGGPEAHDARGHPLRIALALRGGTLLLKVDDTLARYPLRIDPFIQQGKLTPGDPTGVANFGISAALSADGNTALIGGADDNNLVGAAWVFTRSGGTWTQQGPKLTGGGESNQAEFGTAVALSADGNTALIGGPIDAVSQQGAAWVFTRSGGVWTQQGPKLVGSGAANAAEQGSSVALSGDGSTALVGADAGGRTASGSAWVFTRSGSTWTQQGSKLTTGNAADLTNFGHGVALSADGNTALIGAPDDGTPGPGGAWVFTRSGTTWTLGPKLLAGNNSAFGWGVALSADASTALISGPDDGYDQSTNSAPGAAWVFNRSGSTWSQGPKLTSAQSGVYNFGTTVALSGDGSTALIGNNSVAAQPRAWLFARSGSTWALQASPLTPTDRPSDVAQYATSVALSFDGTTAVAGGEGSPPQGAAWVFVPGTSSVPPPPGGGPPPSSSALPANTARPTITGTAKAARTLTCSPGKWTHSPTHFAYRWGRDGTPIAGATTRTYRVQISDEGLTLTCTVTASNGAGAGKPATSSGTLVKVPFVPRCPAATGRLNGRTLGLLRLGMTRSQAHHQYVRSSTRGRTYQDFFCLTPIGVRAGYGSPAVVDALPRAQRSRFAGRVIWASTASAYYAINGIRAGATIAAAGQRLALEPPFQIGANTWYLAPNGASTAVLKVRHGIVEEIGIGEKALTGNHKAQLRFLTHFT